MDPPDENEAPALVDALIARAESVGASDVHLQSTTTGIKIAFRLDGQLCPVETRDNPIAERILGRIKYLSKLQTWQSAIPQDGRIPKEETTAKNDVRVATYPTVTGEKIVLRLFQQTEAPALNDLNHSEDVAKQLSGFLKQPSGMLLLTGPAGSGKTTTIYACLSELIAQGGRHIITIEDPVEQILDGVMQTEVNEPQGLSYAKAARHLMRQDPQVLVIGEIRDDETAQIAVRTALTGHLVISTLHAGSCRGVFERLWTMVPDSFSVASAVSLIVNQRLIRRVCDHCHGEKCDNCLQTGYHGRIPIGEWVTMDDNLREKLRGEGPSSIEPSSQNLTDQGFKLVTAGLTTKTETKRVIGYDTN